MTKYRIIEKEPGSYYIERKFLCVWWEISDLIHRRYFALDRAKEQLDRIIKDNAWRPIVHKLIDSRKET